MDKIIFSNRLADLRKERGYKTQYALAKAYNEKFPAKRRNEAAGNEGDFGGILGTIKNYENPSKELSPKLSIVCNLCEILNCDIDYLLGKIDVPHHETANIMAVTGLTADAVYFLKTLKDCNNTAWKDGLRAINNLLSEEHFDMCADFWGRLSLFLFGSNTPYRAQFGEQFQDLSAEEVLAILLRENEQILRKMRGEYLKNGKHSREKK